MHQPQRPRPYLGHRPMSHATTVTRSLTAITGDEDQVPLARPYTVDPRTRQTRREAARVRIHATADAIALLGLMSLVQSIDRQEAK